MLMYLNPSRVFAIESGLSQAMAVIPLLYHRLSPFLVQGSAYCQHHRLPSQLHSTIISRSFERVNRKCTLKIVQDFMKDSG